MRIVSGGLRQQVLNGPYLWPDLGDLVFTDCGILDIRSSRRPDGNAASHGGYDLLRVAYGTAISNTCLSSPPPEYIMPAVMIRMIRSGTVNAVCAFLDAAMDSYQECLSAGSLASINPPPLSLDSLTSCNQRTALSLLPRFLSTLRYLFSVHHTKDQHLNVAEGTNGVLLIGLSCNC